MGSLWIPIQTWLPTAKPVGARGGDKVRITLAWIIEKKLELGRFPTCLRWKFEVPSGKHTNKHTKNYGKSQCSMSKSTISTGPFSIANCNKLPEGTSNILKDSLRFPTWWLLGIPFFDPSGPLLIVHLAAARCMAGSKWHLGPPLSRLPRWCHQWV